MYFVYFHLIIKYGITFWGNSADNKSIFPWQNANVRIVSDNGGKIQKAHKPVFKALEILTLPAKHISSLMTLVVNNLEYFTCNFSVHNSNTWKKLKVHRQIAKLSSLHKKSIITSITVFNKLPECTIDVIKDEKHFMWAMKRYSLVQPLYSINEFLDYKYEINTNDCCNIK